MHGTIYHRTDSSKFAVDVAVGEAQYLHADGFDGGGAGFVVGDPFGGEVLGAVEFKDKFGFMAIEINNELSYCLLALKVDRIRA